MNWLDFSPHVMANAPWRSERRHRTRSAYQLSKRAVTGDLRVEEPDVREPETECEDWQAERPP